ncbi:unnamed protein product [Symbiodinium natans]|uniref:Uncharacterized protein n=1 Tax=Symbiodinium natans TaxID=878477 RepID=A0A812TD72_9DINO|nr:unnamed protein product [Symbiodinium natans]
MKDLQDPPLSSSQQSPLQLGLPDKGLPLPLILCAAWPDLDLLPGIAGIVALENLCEGWRLMWRRSLRETQQKTQSGQREKRIFDLSTLLLALEVRLIRQFCVKLEKESGESGLEHPSCFRLTECLAHHKPRRLQHDKRCIRRFSETQAPAAFCMLLATALRSSERTCPQCNSTCLVGRGQRFF